MLAVRSYRSAFLKSPFALSLMTVKTMLRDQVPETFYRGALTGERRLQGPNPRLLLRRRADAAESGG
jgi:hypothetical protein